jgi:tetraacyldisaccharide 4'-kinase
MPFWYQPLRWWAWFLSPIALLLLGISKLRRLMFVRGILKSYKSRLPVIVVGNISVGGNGKTPFSIWLCETLIKSGYKPGIISRGYGGKSERYPLVVDAHCTGKEAGDEPVMMFKRLGIPIVVDPVRSNAAKYLEEQTDVDIIITDDGLQHYALQRDIEIVVVDGKRRFGNQKIMPMGPLRETLSRLNEVDFIINNGAIAENEITMILKPEQCVRVDGEQAILDQTLTVNACAAIGYPQRFFDTLTSEKFTLDQTISFADHHAFTSDDFIQFDDKTPLLMTEKDAVKCTSFAKPNWWYLPISAKFSSEFEKKLLEKIKTITK